ncbi:type VI secretion system VasD/TssJ family lipoprotein [Chitinivorax tropicus]|uniref:Type VI secretion system VasD/TssJ family lipoprotein n=1 Tax=Chitinivorax tropicus TaxID=714531 RepID=A0A840MXN2_9PROT|nr:type VI secretion system lipoprotein TssJ [Chitinivorax tropicus]MBB5019911.1 type VI secretion system VasD/TssJ family lipoprotein [Chitinivorax tropicus]
MMFLHRLAAFAILITLSGCASEPATLAKVGDPEVSKTLGAKVMDAAKDVVGTVLPISKAPADRMLSMQIHVAVDANADDAGRGLAVVAKIYQLQDAEAFSQATQEQLNQSPKADNPGKSETDAKERILIPGKKVQLSEKLGADARYIGVAVFFRIKDSPRWKVAIPLNQVLTDAPLIVGVHRCGLTVSSGLKDAKMLATLSSPRDVACPRG